MKSWYLAIVIAGCASAALAHSDVKNEAVKARMGLMMTLQQATGVIGDMAKGKTPFDAAKAEAARRSLIDAAEKTPAFFKAPETDPKSEALPEIWENWDDFMQKNMALQSAAQALKTGSAKTLGAGMRDLGRSCGACHKAYRVEK